MKNVLIFNDYSPETEHAIGYAMYLTQKMDLNLLIWNISNAPKPEPVAKLVISSVEGSIKEAPLTSADRIKKLVSEFNEKTSGSAITFINAGSFSTYDLRDIVQKRSISMIIKGVSKSPSTQTSKEVGNILNNLNCPLLLVQEGSPFKAIEKIVYAADLRYCRIDVLNQLVQLAKPNDADIQIGHLSAPGLPEMEDSYASSIFKEVICRNMSYKHLLFSHIKEKNIKKVFDVIVNTMHTDLLVLINRSSHLVALIGPEGSCKIPSFIPIPMLIFPS